MFKKVLIANRGEIACRIIRTLRRMGIISVAVYSEADENALHVEMADEAYPIGPASVLESYLNSQAILGAAVKSGSEAIHPGYGFLSENPHFARAVQKKGLVFIGPSPEAIESMGDKLEAKRIALKAGMTCLPGSDQPLKDITKAGELAQEIGYPIMVKAAAGGGGKGMRIVRDPSDLQEALKSTMREAKSSFGDGRVFLEKYIDSARHIEVQILADAHGNVIHLGERECSLQRRHQKVIEEAPSPFVTPDLRQQITDQAVRLAKTMNYSSVGTIEFVVDSNRNFYFLEMNTRLQVEHPTTEMITGLDLVEEMIRIAVGEPLCLQQKDVHLKGHSIEARIYAEDSSRGFLPSTGHIRTYLPPEDVRLDSGVREGDSLTSFYDPLMAKLIVHELDRRQACETLEQALNGFSIRGVSTNLSFLSSLVNSSFFRENDFDTTTLDQRYGDGFTPGLPPDLQIPVGVAAVIHCIRTGLIHQDITVLIDREAYTVTVSYEGEQYEVRGKESTLMIETQWKSGEVFFKAIFNGHEIVLQVNPHGIRDELSWNGYSVTAAVVSPRVAELIHYMPVHKASDSSKLILAPMPGRVIEINVAKGELIKAGQVIATLEAMKMENVIRSKCEGHIEEIFIKTGDSVNLDQPLMKMG